MRLGKSCLVGLVIAAGCDDAIDLDPLDKTPPVESRVRPKPISGGTLTIVGDFDELAVAADPDRDLVHVVDLDAGTLLHTITLEADDEPGRVVESSDGMVHVVLRGFGGIATLDPVLGEITARTWVCAEPRGIGHHALDDSLHVACADGALVQLDAVTGTELARTQLEPDLRDVVVADGVVNVSLFREAAIIGTDGTRIDLDSGDFAPRVAWRTFYDDSVQAMVMLHQLADTRPVPINTSAEDLEDPKDLPYGGGGGDSCQPGLNGPAITIVSEGVPNTFALANARLTVDAALDPSSGLLALAMPGIEEGRASVQVKQLGDGCFDDDDDDEAPPVLATLGQFTAVAFAADGRLVMQSREPALIVIQSDPPNGEDMHVIELEGEARFDTGHEIFHRATESSLSCASCHPEGADDGHVWTFEELGKRRTQTLDIGIGDTAPFHWDGDMEDLDMIVAEVLAHRMGGKRQTKERAESFASWMFEQRRAPARTLAADDPLVESGEALFAAYACDKCHSGEDLGGKTTETFRGQELQVPSLRRVSLRPPFMHDGRATTLEAAVLDMIEETATADPPQENVDAIVAYMRTL